MAVMKPLKEQKIRWIRALIDRYGESPYLLAELELAEMTIEKKVKCKKTK